MTPLHPSTYGRVADTMAGNSGTDYQALCDNGPVQTVRDRSRNQYVGQAGQQNPVTTDFSGFLEEFSPITRRSFSTP